MALDGVRQDVRYAFRTLRRAPGFAAVAILTLAVGIGTTTAIYSVVDAILLRPLPFADSDRLVRLLENVPRAQPGLPPFQRGIPYPLFLESRSRTKTFSNPIAIGSSVAVVSGPDGTMRLWGASISADALPLLGARARFGRTLVAGDEADPNVAVLGFDAWRRLFRSDEAIVGKTFPFLSAGRGPRPVTIVGVLQAGFELPTGLTDYYTPLVLDAAAKTPVRVTMVASLRPGVPLESAVDEANAIGAAILPPLPADTPPMTVPRVDVQRLKDLAVRDLRPALRLFLVAVGIVLAIVCANVANLLLARGAARQRDLAVRSAIGASRRRIVRQLLTEAVVLAAIGGAAGALVGAGGVMLVKALASVEAPGVFRLSLGASILPRVNEIGIDFRVFATAFLIAAVASVAFGLLPALRLSRPDHLHPLRRRGAGGNGGESRIRQGLVVGQLVMATVLLVSAGLLVRSFGTLLAVDRGYDPSNVLAFNLVFPPDYPISRKVDTIESVLGGIRATPEVTAAGFTRASVLIGEQITIGTFVPQGRTLDEMRSYPERASLRPVSRGYLTALGVPMLQGRELDADDVGDSTAAIVISRSVARQFGEGSHVGRLVEWHAGKGAPVPLRVVGVVEDLRNTSPARDPYPEVFIGYRDLLTFQQRWGEAPLMQHERSLGLLSFAVRTRSDPAAVIPAVTRIIRAVDVNAGIDAIVPIDRLVANSVARPRFYAVIAGVFAAVASLLALVGVYGLLAYAVTERTQEIGVRMALGAQRGQVLALVLWQGLMLTAVGVAVGLAAAAAATRVLQGMLFGITPLDGLTFAAVAAAFCLVAALACYVPARRATKVDPMVALRAE
jgi:putative ABC transport system permease protein